MKYKVIDINDNITKELLKELINKKLFNIIELLEFSLDGNDYE
jgi:hypothetical protein